MEYLFRPRTKKKSAAHIWTGGDTACRMWSTGGIKDKSWSRWVVVSLDFVPPSVCTMCASVTGCMTPKDVRLTATTDSRIVEVSPS